MSFVSPLHVLLPVPSFLLDHGGDPKDVWRESLCLNNLDERPRILMQYKGEDTKN